MLASAVQLREFEFQKIFYDLYTYLYFISLYISGVFTKCVRLFSVEYLFSSPLATQEIRSVLENPKVHYRFHKSSSLVSTMNYISQFNDLPSYTFTIHFNINFPSRLCLSSNLFLSGFSSKTLYAFLFSPHVDFITLIDHFFN
jgi:hypothetical protein